MSDIDPYQPVPLMKIKHPEWSRSATIYQVSTRASSWYAALHLIAQGRADLNPLYVYYSWNEKAYPEDSMRMNYVSNHDTNSADGTEFELFGEALEAAVVLSVVGEGMPLIYNGQEAGNPKRLLFFDKDPIEWKHHPLGDLYKKLFALKKANSALWNGKWGARMIDVPNSVHTRVMSFVRQNDRQKVFVVLNFSDQPQQVMFPDSLHHGVYTEYFSGNRVEFSRSTQLELKPWDYRVYLK